MIYLCLEFLNGGELFTLLGLKQSVISHNPHQHQHQLESW